MRPENPQPAPTLALSTRRAIHEDAERLSVLAGALGYPATPQELAGRLAELARDPEAEVFVVVDGTDGVVGWVHVLVMKTLVGLRRAHLGGLVVDEQYRGQKVGRTLLARAEDWAREQGCAEMVLRSRHTRRRAHAFYEGLGYARTKTQHVFRREL